MEFEEISTVNPLTNRKYGAVKVIRNGRQVAVLPDANRLRRALTLPIEEVEEIVDNFTIIMGREPTIDEKEFWKAVKDYKTAANSNKS